MEAAQRQGAATPARRAMARGDAGAVLSLCADGPWYCRLGDRHRLVNFLAGGEGLSTNKMMIYTVGPGCRSVFPAPLWVTRRVEENAKREITRGFPECAGP